MNPLRNVIDKWKNIIFFKKELLPALSRQAGQHPFVCLLADPDAENKYMAWVDARVQFARQPTGISVLQLQFFPLLPLDPPVDGEEWTQADVWTITFRKDEYPQKKSDIQRMVVKANSVGAKAIAAVLIDAGDAILELFNEKTQ